MDACDFMQEAGTHFWPCLGEEEHSAVHDGIACQEKDVLTRIIEAEERRLMIEALRGIG